MEDACESVLGFIKFCDCEERGGVSCGVSIERDMMVDVFGAR
jgi:hypothetical protein